MKDNISSHINKAHCKQSVWDDLGETIDKASAMVEVTLCKDFWTFGENTHYHYFWAISDLIEHAQKLFEQLNK